MPNILVIGATGYIGAALCQQLIRSGNHQVFGLAKDKKSGFHLSLNEIIPLSGNLDDPSSLLDLVSSAKTDVIVDTTSFNDKTTKPKLLEVLVGAATEHLSRISETKTFKGPKLGFVTVTGIWSHGSTEDPFGSFGPAALESSSTSPSLELTAARSLYEQKVLDSTTVLDVAVIRPSFIFARGGAAWTKCLKPLVDASRSTSTETVRIPVDPKHSIYCFTNIDDVASGLELAVDKIQLINGSSVYPVFDLVGDRFPIELLFEADAHHFGYRGKLEFYKPEGISFLDSIGGTADANSVRAELILGWKAKKPHFVRDTHIYAHSFLAALALAEEK